jgi:hypothetical protein
MEVQKHITSLHMGPEHCLHKAVMSTLVEFDILSPYWLEDPARLRLKKHPVPMKFISGGSDFGHGTTIKHSLPFGKKLGRMN